MDGTRAATLDDECICQWVSYSGIPGWTLRDRSPHCPAHADPNEDTT